MRRVFLKQLAALSASAALSPLAFGQTTDWPTRPIKLLVPYPPGGALDPIARILGPKLTTLLGQPIVIENRPGANTAIAAGAVAKAEPDGYTLLFTSASTHVIHTIQAPRGYDAVQGFTPVAAVSAGDYMMAINASVPANTLQEFIAYGRANPDKISAGAAGSGNADHLAAELFKLNTGIKLTSVPYKGSAAALMDLVAGRVQMMITTQSLMQPQVDAGKLRMLAYTYQPTDKPAVPTFAQAGVQGFETFGLLNMVLAPPGTPAPVIARLSGAIERALEMPDTSAAIAAVNQSAYYLSPAALRERLTSDSVRFADIIKKADIKFD